LLLGERILDLAEKTPTFKLKSQAAHFSWELQKNGNGAAKIVTRQRQMALESATIYECAKKWDVGGKFFHNKHMCMAAVVNLFSETCKCSKVT